MLSTPLLETADVLPRKQVSLTVGGAGAAGTSSPVFGGYYLGGAVGGGLRLRIGIGNDQEIGIDTVANGFTYRGADAWAWAFGTRFSWKESLVPGVAVIAGLGFIVDDGPAGSFGGDVAFVSSTSSLGGSPHVHLYGGARLGVQVYTASNTPIDVTLFVNAPIGLAFDASGSVRFFVEIGPTGSYTLGGKDATEGYLVGGSGAVGIRGVFGR